jgi:hypothetical protein
MVLCNHSALYYGVSTVYCLAIVVVQDKKQKTTPHHNGIHDHPLYLACPNVLSPVGELLSEDGWGSSNPI